MKKIISLLFALSIFVLIPSESAMSQVLNPAKKTKKESEKRANKNVDKGINKGFDELEKGIGGLFNKNRKQNASQKTEVKQTDQVGEQPEDELKSEAEAPSLKWAKYDFIPGDKVIFEDNHEDEENGEFPSRWDLVRGTIENAEFGGDNIIMFRGGAPTIVPYLKNPEKDYLPEVFTIEFDLYLNNPNSFQLFFWDKKNQKTSSTYNHLDIRYDGLYLSPAGSKIPQGKTIKNQWGHIAIAYTRGKMKAYINETRLINIPHLEFDPMGISLYAYSASDETKFYIKNFRIAEGGVKYYDRFLQDGKIVSNGIRFDVGKATLLPESMGVINEIYGLLAEHAEVKVSVDGHTDSDGDFDMNQQLSDDRARAVMNQLVAMGIAQDRLISKGFGESKPMDTNDTPEGKANNRRVEFVKM